LLQGSGFLAGFDVNDYNVSVGGGWVEKIIDITDNEIICLPPDQLTADQVRGGATDGTLAGDGLASDRLTDGASDPHGASDREPALSPEDGLHGLHTVDVVVLAGTLHTMLAGTLAYRLPEKPTNNSTMIITLSVVLSVAFVSLVATLIGKCALHFFIFSSIYIFLSFKITFIGGM
jgi:hypothetical protein